VRFFKHIASRSAMDDRKPMQIARRTCVCLLRLSHFSHSIKVQVRCLGLPAPATPIGSIHTRTFHYSSLGALVPIAKRHTVLDSMDPPMMTGLDGAQSIVYHGSPMG
jgi:hypothetical protein